MALKDRVALGMSLPHRSADPIPATVVRQVAVRAEALGFQDLWVANNTLDEAESFDSLTTLTYAAAVTTTIRLGVSVLVLPIYHPVHVAHQVATLDRLSGGRVILGVGIGTADDYAPFHVPTACRVRRFLESVGLIKALWADPHTTFSGDIFRVHEVTLGTRPTQQPHPPIWMGGAHPDAIRRAAVRRLDGGRRVEQCILRAGRPAAARGTPARRPRPSHIPDLQKDLHIRAREPGGRQSRGPPLV